VRCARRSSVMSVRWVLVRPIGEYAPPVAPAGSSRTRLPSRVTDRTVHRPTTVSRASACPVLAARNTTAVRPDDGDAVTKRDQSGVATDWPNVNATRSCGTSMPVNEFGPPTKTDAADAGRLDLANAPDAPITTRTVTPIVAIVAIEIRRAMGTSLTHCS